MFINAVTAAAFLNVMSLYIANLCWTPKISSHESLLNCQNAHKQPMSGELSSQSAAPHLSQEPHRNSNEEYKENDQFDR